MSGRGSKQRLHKIRAAQAHTIAQHLQTCDVICVMCRMDPLKANPELEVRSHFWTDLRSPHYKPVLPLANPSALLDLHTCSCSRNRPCLSQCFDVPRQCDEQGCAHSGSAKCRQTRNFLDNHCGVYVSGHHL